LPGLGKRRSDVVHLMPVLQSKPAMAQIVPQRFAGDFPGIPETAVHHRVIERSGQRVGQFECERFHRGKVGASQAFGQAAASNHRLGHRAKFTVVAFADAAGHPGWPGDTPGFTIHHPSIRGCLSRVDGLEPEIPRGRRPGDENG
jgi:hypothetical protein